MSPALENAGDVLAALNASAAERTRARLATLFEPGLGGSREIVIFGTGELGRKIAASARSAGLTVRAAADNNVASHGGAIDGTAVLEPSSAFEAFGKNAVFVVAIYNPKAVVEQLRAAGCTRIATYPQFFLHFSTNVSGMTGLALPEAVLAAVEPIRAAYDLLADDASRREYAAQIDWRISLDDTKLDPPQPFGDMHFDRNVYKISKHETLVDCGAFDGDSLRAFLAKTNDAFAHAYAIEPDPANREHLETNVELLGAEAAAKITILPFAAAERNGFLRFEGGLGVESVTSVDGDLEVACRRLDDLISDAPTLIKMDIEGAEPSALRGAASLIRKHRPVLAICAYHYCEHLWELPVLLRSLAPQSKIYLRRYAQQCWETVFYAVPPERAVVP